MSDPLEVEFQMAVSFHVGIKPRSSTRTAMLLTTETSLKFSHLPLMGKDNDTDVVT